MVLTSPPAPPQPSRPGEGPGAVDAYEETHVHGVYEAIAPHFSATRHRPWPFVSSFLASQPPGSVGLDVGCGNGKNMGVNRDVVMLGCDRSAALVGLARDLWCSRRYRRRQHDGDGDDLKEEQKKVEVGVEAEAADGTDGVIQGADVAVADSLVLPFREAGADFAICIAVIHHLSTRERRVDAIRQLLRCIRRRVDKEEEEEEEEEDDDDDEGDVSGGAGGGGGGGRVLVYVWALEQSSSRRGWDEGGEQDLLVPWVMKAPPQKKGKEEKKTKTKTKTQKKQKKQPKGPNQGQGQGQGRDAVANENTTAAENNLERAGGGVLAGGEDGETLQGQQERQQRQHEQRQEQQQQQQQQGVDAAATAAAGTAERDSDDSKQQQQQQQQQEDRQADKTFHRYYHLYRKGELEEEVVSAGGKVISSGYERDNWWVIAG